MKYTVAIIDDEELVRERLRTLLAEYPDFIIKHECTNGLEAIKSLERLVVDVIFIDVKMPKANGFHVLDQIDSSNSLIVFITAFENYALRAFDYEAFDYLLKPITINRFSKTILRVLRRLEKHQKLQTITLREGRIIHKVAISDITHLEASNNHVLFHTPLKSFRIRSTLMTQVQKLRNYGFHRIHRSYVVNEDSIQSMSHIYNGEYLIQLISGRIIPSSRAYHKIVKYLNAR